MSPYNPRTQGCRDARRGKPRHLHTSAWRQERYDCAYDEEMARQAAEPAATAKPGLTELEAELLGALQQIKVLAPPGSMMRVDAEAAIAKATGEQPC